MKLQRRWLVCLLATPAWGSSGFIIVGPTSQVCSGRAPQNYSESAAVAVLKEAGPLSAAGKDTIKLMVDHYMSAMTDPRKPMCTNPPGRRAAHDGFGRRQQVAAEKVVEIAKSILNLQANYHPSVRINTRFCWPNWTRVSAMRACHHPAPQPFCSRWLRHPICILATCAR